MSGLEIVLQVVPVSAIMCITGSFYFFNNKRKYKQSKNKIYKYIKSAIAALDFDDIIKGFEMLKDFDTRHSDEEGKPNKKYLEKLLYKERLPKCDKTEKLFGVPSEMVDDITQIKKHFNNKLKKENLKEHLEKVEEEEKEENEVLINLKQKLKKIKVRQLAENNSNRKVIDDLNLTDIIKELHEEYENLFIKTFEQEKDLHNILQRSVKKQILIKKMNMLSEKKKVKGNLKSC